MTTSTTELRVRVPGDQKQGQPFLLTSKGVRPAVTQKLLGPTAPGELLSWAKAGRSAQMLEEATTTHGAKGPVTITGVPQTDKG